MAVDTSRSMSVEPQILLGCGPYAQQSTGYSTCTHQLIALLCHLSRVSQHHPTTASVSLWYLPMENLRIHYPKGPRAEKDSREDSKPGKVHATHRSTRYKDKYQQMRARFDKVTSTNDQYLHDLERAQNKIRKLEEENELLLDAMLANPPPLLNNPNASYSSNANIIYPPTPLPSKRYSSPPPAYHPPSASSQNHSHSHSHPSHSHPTSLSHPYPSPHSHSLPPQQSYPHPQSYPPPLPHSQSYQSQGQYHLPLPQPPSTSLHNTYPSRERDREWDRDRERERERERDLIDMPPPSHSGGNPPPVSSTTPTSTVHPIHTTYPHPSRIPPPPPPPVSSSTGPVVDTNLKANIEYALHDGHPRM